ncbi:Protein of unknown function [Gryllus bimaculatus]|nr:Protein of unknown function [Gryllus bimaculatus]
MYRAIADMLEKRIAPAERETAVRGRKEPCDTMVCRGDGGAARRPAASALCGQSVSCPAPPPPSPRWPRRRRRRRQRRVDGDGDNVDGLGEIEEGLTACRRALVPSSRGCSALCALGRAAEAFCAIRLRAQTRSSQHSALPRWLMGFLLRTRGTAAYEPEAAALRGRY